MIRDAMRDWRLRRAYAREGIGPVALALGTTRDGHAAILRDFGASIAPGVAIAGPLHVVNAAASFANLTIGARAALGLETHLDLAAAVTIGPGAVIEPRAALLTSARAAGLPPGALHDGPVRVGAGARIGAGATLLPGVTIGEGAVIDPHALVAADVPAGTRFAWHQAADLALVRGR